MRHDALSGGRMLFMVIETFKGQNAQSIYRRLDERGRMMPEGLRYIDSWIQADFRGCFQLMECGDARLFQQWIANWSDLIEFEIIPVGTSEQTVSAIEAGDKHSTLGF